MNLWEKHPDQATGKVSSKLNTMWNSKDNLRKISHVPENLS